MISDEERREVAEKMRGYDVSEFKESAIVPFLDCLGVGYLNWREVLDTLADLIDRPTCHDATDNSCEFVCSKCGCSLDISNDFEPTLWVDGKATVPSYCPNCGAEVLDD